MNDRNFENKLADAVQGRYKTLLKVTESIAVHRDLADLFHDLAESLRSVLDFDYLSMRLHDPEGNVMRKRILENSAPVKLDPELPVDGSLAGWVWENQQPVLINDIEHEPRFPRAMQVLRENRIKSCCALPLRTAHGRLGAMTLGSVRDRAYQTTDLAFLEQVAKQVAVAVDNALTHENAQSYQQQLARERDHLRLLLDVTNAVVSSFEIKELLASTAQCLRLVMPHEYTTLTLYDPEINQLRLHALEFPAGQNFVRQDATLPVEGTPAGLAYSSRKPVVLSRRELVQLTAEIVPLLLTEKIQSVCCVPLISHDHIFGTLNVASLREDAFVPENVQLLSQVASQVAIAVENALAYRQIEQLKDRLAEEKLYLEDEIRTEYNFEEIIGESAALKRILRQVETVAPTDSTVLLLGETGTGKELFARALHNLSLRRDRTLVKVNCAAIPTGLLESELFGHEKGAFTGAITQRIGRFELANRGTIFLDEIGDIPLELQPKLLRVLQEQEFERLGGTRTLRVDVRIIAATNSNLAAMVERKQFRSDLFYRLNVFPIVIPPLRERPEDIPLLVRHFAQKYGSRMKKPIGSIPASAMKSLTEYHWPGNVRELENFIERAVILSRGSELNPPFAELAERKTITQANSPGGPTTLKEAEREHILRTLEATNWVIGGNAGAAARLGMKRTTLQSLVQRLGIVRPKKADISTPDE